jgi:hypothetical protein
LLPLEVGFVRLDKTLYRYDNSVFLPVAGLYKKGLFIDKAGKYDIELTAYLSAGLIRASEEENLIDRECCDSR